MGALEGAGSLLTDPVGTVGEAWDAIVEDPVGLILSKEFREAWKNGDWPAAFGYGLWDIGTTLVGGVGILLKGGKAFGKLPQGSGEKPPKGSDPDKDSGQNPDKEDSADGEKKDEDNNAAGCPPGNSFLPGTPVLLADGTTAPIENVAVGNEVWAFDPLTGEEGPRPVTATITGSGEKTLVEITTVDDEGDTGSVTATDEHPFWVPDVAEWVDAIDLEPGTWLRTSSGTWVQVTATKVHTAANAQVHNLTVGGLHTYYVGTIGASVLVHNKSGCVPGGGLRKHEELGGHTIERHVAKSEKWLRRRLKNDPDMTQASSFKDLSTAERAISKALSDNQGAIDKWIDSDTGGQLKLEKKPVGENVGPVVRRDGSSKDGRRVTIILRKDKNSSTGYRVHTAFPDK
ncbi:RNase A-like domain-containing protein [Nocardiopsis gilva]|uniref:RNase A-like domain-containing protein n=1 Tax=Nocardiopsis gilva TaxID=280236 RepID=UPI00034ACE88|nr:RNase A-like domain-containing protein [Nocardiopsis gilva]